MADFPSAKPSLGLFFGSVAPRLAPRFYSISSSSMAHPRAVHVTCAVVREVRRLPRVHTVCSCLGVLPRCVITHHASLLR
jgi:NADPH-ferrihemoprotein reductase